MVKSMIKKLILLGLLCLVSIPVFSQQGIGTANPESSAVLELKSNSAGFLITRLTDTQMYAIASPADGLLVYCTDCPTKGIYAYNIAVGQFLLNGPSNILETTVPAVKTVSSTVNKYGEITAIAKITDVQEATITEKGFCYSTNPNPTINTAAVITNVTELENNQFSFITDVLAPSTIWYIRPFTTNQFGTGYGEVTALTTQEAFVMTILPTGEFRIPLDFDNDTYDLAIGWGDGTSSKVFGSVRNTGQEIVKHTYSDAQIRTVIVYGDFGKFRIYDLSPAQKAMLRDISSWGNAIIGQSGVFNGAINMTISAERPPIINTTNFGNMFQNCAALNTDLSSWDVSSVTNFSSAFEGATNFNNGGAPLPWDVGNATNMSNMFQQAIAFNQDISDWDVSNVTTMSYMFYKTDAFNNGGQPLDWGNKTSSVIAMDYMFAKGQFNQEINDWDVSSVTNMQNMFETSPNFNQSLSSWDTSSVVNMRGMFYNTGAFNQDISAWNLQSVTNTNEMFRGSTFFNNGATGTDTDHPLEWKDGFGNNANLSYMFYQNTVFNQDISDWNVSNVIDLTSMFQYASGFNNGGVVLDWINGFGVNARLDHMFSKTSAFNQDISAWDVSNVLSMNYMFENNKYFNNGAIGTATNKPLYWSDSKNFTRILTLVDMFKSADAFNQDVSSWDLSTATNLSTMFGNALLFNNGGVSLNWAGGFGNNANLFFMFGYTSAFNQDISDWDVTNVTNMERMFLTSTAYNNGGVALDWSNTANVTKMANMFNNATAFNQDIDTWDISSVTNMHNMFNNATAFNSLIPTNRSQGNPVLTDISGMFHNAIAFNQNVNVLNVSNVTSMRTTFNNARAFNNGGVSLNWGSETAKVTNWAYAFQNARVFNNEGVINLDMSGATLVNNMFESAVVFNQNISNWNMSKVTDMGFMFSNASSFNQDISKKQVTVNGETYIAWNTSKVTNMSYMFSFATSFNQNLSGWCVPLISSVQYRFDYTATAWDLARPNWGNCPL
jgi:surface protein